MDIDISTHNIKLTTTRNKKCAILEDFIEVKIIFKVPENVSYNRKTQRKGAFRSSLTKPTIHNSNSKEEFAPTLDVCL